jgi:hypothetical protein
MEVREDRLSLMFGADMYELPEGVPDFKERFVDS